MRKLFAAINMTLDGFCDHTAGIPDEEIHYHYADLLNNAGVVLYGRITYQLMQYWQTLLNNPSGVKLNVRGCDLWEFRDGKITRKNSFWKIVEHTNQPATK